MTEVAASPPAEFGAAWAGLEPQLRRALSTAPAHVVDDVLQETSIKLLKVWGTVDHDRPVLPLAVTIARNTLRDELRRTARHDHAELFEEAGVRDDLDTVVSARLELARIGAELTRLTPGQRAALLTEVGGGSRTPDTPKVKMLRSRARARLRELVAQAGGFVVTGIGRLRSSSAERMAACAPELGVLAQAFLLAVVVTGGSVAPPVETPGSSSKPLAGGAVVRTSQERAAMARAGSAVSSVAPISPSRESAAVAAAPPPGDGAGPPARPGLPSPPIPQSKGTANEGGYLGTEGYSEAGEMETTAAGHDVGYRYESEWSSPGCVQDLAEGQSPRPCTAPKAPSAEAEVEVDGRRHRVDTDGPRR